MSSLEGQVSFLDVKEFVIAALNVTQISKMLNPEPWISTKPVNIFLIFFTWPGSFQASFLQGKYVNGDCSPAAN